MQGRRAIVKLTMEDEHELVGLCIYCCWQFHFQ